jgi:hypothetical protein
MTNCLLKPERSLVMIAIVMMVMALLGSLMSTRAIKPVRKLDSC